jgi:RimJ/RimL family protein N-acetyltransferase
MINITRSHHLHELHEILLNPILFSCTYGQSDTKLTIDELENKQFLDVRNEEGTLLGGFEIKEVTAITLEGHIFIHPSYWKQTKEIIDAGHLWAKQHGYKVIFTHVPANCLHMLKFMNRMGYEACGQIENGIVYKGQLVTLFLYNKQL